MVHILLESKGAFDFPRSVLCSNNLNVNQLFCIYSLEISIYICYPYIIYLKEIDFRKNKSVQR